MGNSRIYVIEPTKFGGFKDSDIPVVIGYNQVHYESLHPITDEDIEKTKLLVNSYTTGNYTFKKNDIKFFISSDIDTNGDKKDEKNSPANSLENINNQIEDELSDLLKIKPAARTIGQKKRIKQLYNLKNTQRKQKRKAQETPEQKCEEKLKDIKRKH